MLTVVSPFEVFYPASNEKSKLATAPSGAVVVAGLVDFETGLEDIGAAFERASESELVKGIVTVE